MTSGTPSYPLLETKTSYGHVTNDEGHIEKTTTHSSQFSKTGLSILTAATLVSGKIAGLGIQILPGAISETGAWGFVVALTALFLSAFSGTLLSKCWIILRHRYSKYRTEINRYPYPTLAYEAYGIWGRRIASVLLYLYGIAICTTGLLVLSDNLVILLAPRGIPLSTCVYLPIVAVCICPLLWLGTPKDFWFTGYCAILTAMVASGFLFAGAIIDRNEYEIEHTIDVDVVALFSGIGNIIFAYAGQSVFPTVQHDMKNPEDFTKSVMIGYGLIAVVYFPTTIACVVVYGTAYQELLMSNILDAVTKNYIQIPFIILIMVYTIPVIMITSNPFFQDAEDFFNVPYEFTWRRCVLRSLYTMFLLLVATTFPHFTTFLPLIGGPLVAIVNFILPTALYVKLKRMDPMVTPPESILPICLSNIGHVMLILLALIGAGMSSGTALYQLIHLEEGVYPPCYVNTSFYSVVP